MLGDTHRDRALELLAEHGSDLVSIHDLSGFCSFASNNSTKLFGWTPEELTSADIYEFCHPDDIGDLRVNFANPDPPPIEYRMRRKEGEYAIVFMRPAVEGDNRICFTSDLTHTRNLLEANDRLAAQARTDALTGIDNYLGFQDRMELVLAEAQRGRRFSFLLGDIDNFKVFNDTFGHQAGDKVLRMVAQAMKQAVRKVDFVARYGGEEFVLLLPDTDKEGAEILGNRIRERVTALKHDYDRPITMCFGVCTYDHKQSREGLISCADKHLYDAKSHGKNRVEVCTHRVRAGSCSG
jgi:diguanylate cyclase (GGDEF)-like protein/PAS domain S-box-containing protein